MRHSSIKLNDPVEFINSQEINPLISKVQIKVCYVGEDANRNGSIITKEVARKIAPTLRGCPIVGFYNEEKADFEEHNRVIEVKNGEWIVKDTTRPYGFVDLNARLWFQKFLDDGRAERTYLMTEGYLWTEQYPEANKILTEGKGQSMELDEKTLQGSWTDDNWPSFYIINDAILSKLCILGDDVEPCFEGANITEPTIQFSFDPSFKAELFSMIAELKELIGKGGEQVELDKDIEMIEEEVAAEPEVTEEAEVQAEETTPVAEETEAEAEVAVEPEAEEPAPAYSLDQIPEYVELMKAYTALEENFNKVSETVKAFEAELNTLRAFKLEADRKEKNDMINKFFMLSDEDKADVINNIDKYSLNEIEAKLSVICFRNKISFAAEKAENEEGPVSYNLQAAPQENDSTPDWIKAVRETQESMN